MLTYETIMAACHGDPVAQKEAVADLEWFIDILSTHSISNDGIHKEHGIDPYMKGFLTGKLLSAIPHFAPYTYKSRKQGRQKPTNNERKKPRNHETKER